MEHNKKLTIKLSEEEKKLLLELLEVEKKKYEALLFKSNKKPRDYSLLESILMVLQQPAIAT